jgi:hypothetical protein
MPSQHRPLFRRFIASVPSSHAEPVAPRPLRLVDQIIAYENGDLTEDRGRRVISGPR